MHHAGMVPRESTGIVRYEMENIGRRLVRIDLDSGRSLILLAEDIACEAAVDTPREADPVVGASGSTNRAHPASQR